MPRLKTPLLLTTALALAACDQSDQDARDKVALDVVESTAGVPAAAPPVVGYDQTQSFRFSAGTADGNRASADKPNQPQSGESYVYDHSMTVSMASAFIKTRFERARDLCQNDPALKCKVTSASFRLLGTPDAPLPYANLSVALPHDAVAVFENALLSPLSDENASDVRVTSRNTNAQNVTNQVRDIQARLAQLADYRDRMTQLAKRGGAKTDDLIKIEGEISRTQSEIEQIEGQRRDLADRIAKENLTIVFQAQSTTSDAFQPVAEVWQSSLRVLGASTAAVLALGIGIIPWLPVIVLLYFLVRWLWRRARRKNA